MLVTFNSSAKTISVNQPLETIDIADIYLEWEKWATNESQAPAAFRMTGGDQLPKGETLAKVFFLINGWRIIVDCPLVFTGTFFADDEESPFIGEDNCEVITEVSSFLRS